MNAEYYETPSGSYISTPRGGGKITSSYEFEPALIVGDSPEIVKKDIAKNKKIPWWIVLAAGAGALQLLFKYILK